MTTRSLLLLSALMAGCSFFKFNIDTPAKRREAEEAQAREAEAGRAKAAQESRVAAEQDAAAQQARDEQAMRDIEALRAEINAPCAAGAAACTRDLGADGAKAIRFASVVASAKDSPAARDGKLDMPALQAEALGYLEQATPGVQVLDVMASLPVTPETDAAVLRACPGVRPAVPAANWTANTAAGEVRVACNFGNCLKDGWTARLPDGSEVRTTCNFGDCMKDGWETRYSDGSSARTTCNFSNCPKDGWETQLPGGASARTTCNFGDCFKDGWTTQMPSGQVRCSCNFSKCLTDGTTCD